MSEISDVFADKVPGVDLITIAKLEKIGITTLAQLKDTGWKHIAEVSNIGPKKLIAIFNQLGETLDENTINAYRDEIAKVKVTPDLAPGSIPESKSTITPITYTASDIEAMAAQVGAGREGFVEQAVKEGKLILLTSEQQKFKKMTPTSDMYDFLKALSSNPSQMYVVIRSSILNATDILVPTGARAHVKQWVNLLEEKHEGKKGIPIDSFNTAFKFRQVLEPLIDRTIQASTNELQNGSLNTTITQIEANVRPDISTIMNTVILYKIYVDAAGSEWDGQASTGQLGASFKDGAEFIRRMGERLRISTKDAFSEEMMRIKRSWSAYQCGQAILLAGLPGSGKTYYSKAMAETMTDNVWGTLPYTRINITGGLEPQDLLGKWDYQAQILALEASRIKVGSVSNLTGSEIEKLRENIYTIDYFQFGPVAMCMIQGIPILIDEVNRGSEDIQNTLLQAIDENEVIIPGIGRIKASPGFFVISTINEQDVGTTPLGAAFLRRVNYINFSEPTDYTTWVKQEFPDIDDRLLTDIEKVRKAMVKTVALSQEIPPSSISAWARELINLYGPSVVLNKERILETLGTIIKNKNDIDEIRKNINTIIQAAGIVA